MGLLGRKMKSDSTALLYRQLAAMRAIGLRTEEAFDILANESDNPRIKRLSALVQKDLAAGTSLPDSLGKHPKVFSEVLIDILSQEEQGEATAAALSVMADTAESSSDMLAKIWQALYFPMATFIIAIIAFAVIMVFVVPIFKEMFADFGGSLPMFTQVVIDISDWVVANFLYVFIGIILLLACLKKQTIRYKVASVVPGLKAILNTSSIIQFTRHLSVMLTMERHLKQAISSAAGSLNNPLHRKRLQNVGRTLTDSKALSEAMRATGIFPNVILKMIDAGAKSDKLTVVFEEIAKFYEKDFGRSLHRMISSLEILSVIFVGTFVGSLVIAMYLPIFKMAGVVGG